MDLLEYAKNLVSQGHTSHNAHLAQLQEIVSQEKPQRIENRAAPTNSNQNNGKNINTYLLVGGLVLFGLAILAIGY